MWSLLFTVCRHRECKDVNNSDGAGGRNATVGMVSASGVFRRTSIVAMALFTQYWYWFPMSYMLALSFAPTAVIGVTADVKLPKFNVVCQCPKGRFAYAKPVADSSKKKVLFFCISPIR